MKCLYLPHSVIQVLAMIIIQVNLGNTCPQRVAGLHTQSGACIASQHPILLSQCPAQTVKLPEAPVQVYLLRMVPALCWKPTLPSFTFSNSPPSYPDLWLLQKTEQSNKFIRRCEWLNVSSRGTEVLLVFCTTYR